MWMGTVSLLPEMFQALHAGVIGRAIEHNKISLNHWQIRDFAHDTHRTVDDKPFGGGPGMVLMAEPLYQAINAAKEAAPEKARVIHLTPQGTPFHHGAAKQFAQDGTPLIFICGRYEGIDERIIDACVDEEWSIGDYVLSGGELPTMVMIDSISRLIPGVLGHEASAEEDSFNQNLLDFPHYTRPAIWRDHNVPAVLMDGNHQEIDNWRQKQRLGRTWLRRQQLLNQSSLNPFEQKLLSQFLSEHTVGEPYE